MILLLNRKYNIMYLVFILLRSNSFYRVFFFVDEIQDRKPISAEFNCKQEHSY